MDWAKLRDLSSVRGLPGPDGEWDKEKYALYLMSDRWQILRNEALNYYGCRCQFCGGGKDDGLVLQAHHKDYKHLNDDAVAELFDLMILCKDCHEKWHQMQEELPDLEEKYRFVKIQLMSPGLPALINIRNQEIKSGAKLANKLLKGKNRGNGVPNKLYSMIAEAIKAKQPEWLHTSPYSFDIEKYLPGLFEGIQKEENRLYKAERDGT